MTRALSILGAALPAQLMAPNNYNETGYWESETVALLNDEILDALDSDWHDVFGFRPKQYLSNFDRVYLGRAVELLDQEFNGSEMIVLKDPRISVLTTFWERALREAGYETHYVVMVRNPLEVAESLRARDSFPREKSLLLWSSYMLAIERDTRDHSRTFVSYDQLMSDWRGVRRRIEGNAGVPFPRDTAAAAIEIDRFLDPGVRHHTMGLKELFSRGDVSEQVKTLSRIFCEACEGADLDTEALKAIQAEMEELDLLVGPLLADLRGSARALSKQVTDLVGSNEAARERVDSLEELFAAERALRHAEAAAVTQSSTDYEARLAELAETISSTEAERERLAVRADEMARDAAGLGERLATAEAQRIHLIEEVERKVRAESELAERAATADAERIRLIEEVERKTGAEAELADRVAAMEAERIRLIEEVEGKVRAAAGLADRVVAMEARLAGMKAELRATQELGASARAEVAAKDDKLVQRLQEVETLTGLLKNSEREIEVAKRASDEARKNAEEATRASEAKLAQRFQETAALTKLLKQQEERGDRTDDEVGWLLALNERLGKQPRWWSLLPNPSGRRRALGYLRDAGLFDGDAYLERYPDVAAAGRDPLDHYLEHGYGEGRLRKS